jgi:thioredoxin 1
MVETRAYDSFSMTELQGEWLVEFFKDDCVPCKMLSRTLERFQDNTNVLKVHLAAEEDFTSAASSLSVQSVPTMLLVRDGRVLHQSAGFKTPADLARLLDQHFSGQQVPA